MPKEQDSFRDLVAKAPLAPSEGPVSLVGTLARSKDDGKRPHPVRRQIRDAEYCGR
jgi:hypothetical protein